ncbi:EamA family transporter [Aeromicrobium sp. CF3.5]|uniref:EamA family transporter n=1 Tax=Aeromicrobium sp. CF3.5 TaxID=3373078 RepID=UPI003EE666BF
MVIVLSLVSALSYGISDFLGGIFAKRASAWPVAVVGQSTSAVCALTALALFPGSPATPDLVWGLLAGSGGGVGVGFLYRGLSTARMGVVAPISAIGAALLPVAAGLISGERPSLLAFIGIVAAFPAIVLISRVPASEESGTTTASGIGDGALAGLGFGVLFVCLDRVSDGGALTGLAASQVTSVVTVIAVATAMGAPWLPRDRFAARAVVMGPLGFTAQGAFLFATQQGLLSVVSVISSLYPASTVLLAALLLREKILAWQAVGLALAATAVTLVALA